MQRRLKTRGLPVGRALAAATIATVLAISVSAGVSAAPPAGFVTRSGQQLTLDGQPYDFTGINIYNANNAAGCWYPLASGNGLSDSLDQIGNGAKVIRAWFFQSLATSAGTRDWSGFDHTLSVAAAHNAKVVVTLGNQWPDCDGPDGGAGSYKDETWYTNGYKAADPAGTVSYRDFVAQVVTRYRDNPTVLAWQLMNEAEVKPSSNGSCSVNAEGILKAFATDVSGLVKSIDPNHLVSLGTLGGGQCGAQGDEYQDLHSVPTIDLCEYHDYGSPTVPMPGDQFNGLQKRLSQCAALNKPLFVGETGIRPSDIPANVQPNFPLFARADAFEQKFRAQRAAGVVGELVWAWDAQGSNPDDYDIGPSDPTLRVLTVWNSPSKGTTERVSVTAVGAEANNRSVTPHLTPDGRYVLFSSQATNLSPADTFDNPQCGALDVFLKDRQTGAVELENVDSSGTQLRGYCGSFGDGISADGRFVLFESDAYRSTAGTYVGSDVLVRDRVSGTTRNLTAAANGRSGNASITPDGRYVLFGSEATNLVAGVPPCPSYWHQYLYDLRTDTIEIEDVDSSGQTTTCAGGNGSNIGSISADGRYVEFDTDEDLVPEDVGQFRDGDIYVHDRQTGVTRPVSVDSNGVPVDGFNGRISADGRFVAFVSDSSALVPDDTNGPGGLQRGYDVFVYDAASARVERISVDSSGHEFELGLEPSVSAHGRFVAFVAGHNPTGFTDPGYLDIYVRDRQAGTTERVSSSAGRPGGGFGEVPDLSLDGRYVAFSSDGGAYVTGDTNAVEDVFVHTRSGQVDAPFAVAGFPSPPQSVVAAPGDASAAVSWLAPASDGGAAISGYTVTPHDQTAGTTGVPVAAGGLKALVSGLANGHAYTFTVTAANVGGTSAPSAASSAVTPQAGSAPPVAVVGTASPTTASTLTTGTDPAQTGGTGAAVTVPAGTGGGVVSIVQRSTAEAPPTGSGYQFGGVQVDISAPAGTAANPLALVFTFTPPLGQPLDQITLDSARIYRAEGAGASVALADCDPSTKDSANANYRHALPNPCAWDRSYVTIGSSTYIRITVLTSTASHWNTGSLAPTSIAVSDKSYTPASPVLALSVGSIDWSFRGQKGHTVTETAGLGARSAALFDSGVRTSGDFVYRFFAAGTFGFKSTVKGDSFSGTVGVPVRVTPTAGHTNTVFTITWARQPPTGYTFDLQLRFKPAGSKNWKGWANWKATTATTSATLSPPDGKGTYGVQARLRNQATGRVSDYSPETTVDVS